MQNAKNEKTQTPGNITENKHCSYVNKSNMYIYLYKIFLQFGPNVYGGFGISDNLILLGSFVYGK